MHLIVALMLAGTAPDAEQAANNATAAAPAPAEEKKVCRREQSTGSIMTRRVCHTRAEWAAIDQANADAVERAADQRSRAGGT